MAEARYEAAQKEFRASYQDMKSKLDKCLVSGFPKGTRNVCGKTRAESSGSASSLVASSVPVSESNAGGDYNSEVQW